MTFQNIEKTGTFPFWFKMYVFYSLNLDLLCLKMFDKEKLQCFIPKTETILT